MLKLTILNSYMLDKQYFVYLLVPSCRLSNMLIVSEFLHFGLLD